MRHAGPEDLIHLAPLLQKVRALGVLKEPRPGCFYLKGRAVLHLHVDGPAHYADVRMSGRDFSRILVGSKELDEALVADLETGLKPYSR